MAKTERKSRAPARPALDIPTQVEVGVTPPPPPRRRSRWAEYVTVAEQNAGAWVKVGPFYKATAVSAARRVKDLNESAEVESRPDESDSELAFVYIRIPA
jgi:hypothetical protein